MVVPTKRRTAHLAAILTLVLSCFGASASWAQQQTVATVTQVTGTVQLVRAGVTGGVTPAMAVQLHDQLTTGVSSAVTVTLSDNSSTVELGESTTLVFDENVVGAGIRQRTAVRLLTGGISSLVNAALHNGTPTYEVHTPNAVVSSRGTDFDTTYIEGVIRPGYEGCQRYTDVRVREGIVGISNNSNPNAEVDVQAGYETTVPCLLPPLNAGPLGIAGAAGPGTSSGGKGSAGSGGSIGSGGGAAAAAVGFSAPPPGVGSAPPPPPPPVNTVQ